MSARQGFCEEAAGVEECVAMNFKAELKPRTTRGFTSREKKDRFEIKRGENTCECQGEKLTHWNGKFPLHAFIVY